MVHRDAWLHPSLSLQTTPVAHENDLPSPGNTSSGQSHQHILLWEAPDSFLGNKVAGNSLYFHYSITLSFCLSVCMSSCLFVYLPACLFAYLCVCLFVCLPVCLFVSLSVCMSSCLFVCLLACLSASLPVSVSPLTCLLPAGVLWRLLELYANI